MMNDNLEEFDSDTLVPVSQFSRLSWNSSIVSNQAIVTPEGTTTTREKKLKPVQNIGYGFGHNTWTKQPPYQSTLTTMKKKTQTRTQQQPPM